jgi:hypothetical protein
VLNGDNLMKTLLLVLLFSFIGSIQAAKLVYKDHPNYYFDMGEEVYTCKFDFMDQPIHCMGKHKETYIEVKYVCVKARSEDGYIKDCKTKKTF